MSCVQVAAFSRNKRKRQWQSRPLPIIESLTPYHVTDCQKYPIREIPDNNFILIRDLGSP
jgi:hypothetical protein